MECGSEHGHCLHRLLWKHSSRYRVQPQSGGDYNESGPVGYPGTSDHSSDAVLVAWLDRFVGIGSVVGNVVGRIGIVDDRVGSVCEIIGSAEDRVESV